MIISVQKTKVDSLTITAAPLIWRPSNTESMANTKSAAKRMRQSVTRTLQNQRVLTNVKSRLKSARKEISSKNKDAAKAEYQKLSSSLDRAVKAGRIHRNAASRHKSALNKALTTLS